MEAIEDRTRNLKRLPHWSCPQDIIESASYQYRQDLWKDQKYHLEVWVEKEALAEVVQRACEPFDISYFCCRGYVSQSEMWEASRRLINFCEQGKDCLIIHLGDHDPSGIDMSRDIEERLWMFGSHDSRDFSNRFLGLRRIALNMEQIEEFNPPPNPAKITDSRSTKYIQEFGYESWELDALEPKVISRLIEDNVSEFADFEHIINMRAKVESEKYVMNRVCENWDSIYEKYK